VQRQTTRVGLPAKLQKSGGPTIWLACHAISVQLESPHRSVSPATTAHDGPTHVEEEAGLSWLQPVASAPDQTKQLRHRENCDE
jgi:hypothetical protein